MNVPAPPGRMAARFRGFLPVVVDVETGGFDAERHALLEIAAIPIEMGADGRVHPGALATTHVMPFPGAQIDPKSIEITGIDIDHPFRDAVDEKAALDRIFRPVREAVRRNGCQRAILVGHNAAFDLGFLNAAVRRVQHKRNPFHPFSCFDTVTLAGLAYGQTVLGRALVAAGLPWDGNEAHSAVYDTERTAELFCTILNRWHRLSALEAAQGGAPAPDAPDAPEAPEALDGVEGQDALAPEADGDADPGVDPEPPAAGAV